ncbi:MAG: hypothetical protein ACM3NO_07845 [Deltaproteobacteria bacterium]
MNIRSVAATNPQTDVQMIRLRIWLGSGAAGLAGGAFTAAGFDTLPPGFAEAGFNEADP